MRSIGCGACVPARRDACRSSRAASTVGGGERASCSSTSAASYPTSRRRPRAPSRRRPPPRHASSATPTPDDAEDRAAVATASASATWEHFYRTHSGKDGQKGHRVQAYKDRHYLRREFAELMPASVREDPKAWTPPLDPASLPPPDPDAPHAKTILELGCGVGNSAYPLLRANPDMFVHACDCSPTAVDALRANPEHDPRRLNAFVADLADGEGPLVGKIGDASVDAVTGVFFFSALDPPAFARVARECARVLRPGGAVLFRDYAVDDVKNTRGEGDGEVTGSNPRAGGESPSFAPGERVREDVFVRGDGTLAVFADEAAVERAFADAGLIGECWRVTHEVVNRKLDVRVKRSFVQGRFEKPK